MRKIILWLIAAAITTGCGGGQTEQKASVSNDTAQTADIMVETTVKAIIDTATNGVMKTMGKVVAERFADLSFEATLPIERVLVSNGQHVRRGQVLAQLDSYKLRNAIERQQRAIEQAQLQMEQAHLQMQDVIIAQGYDPDKAAQVPAEVLHNADVKSGYALSKSQLASARTQLAVANVTVQAHQLAQAGKPVCRVIASGNMTVEFRVMEADFCHYKIGTVLDIIPVFDQSQHYKATVCEINPMVDPQGAVTLRARLNDSTPLFDGMNVEVVLLRIDN